MSWLLWRESRLNRLILLVALAMVLLPYFLMTCIMLYGAIRGWVPPGRGAEAIGATALYSIGLAQLALVLLAGNAIAGERADRSAEFIAHLPISRARRIVSKVSLSLLATVLIWGFNVIVLLLVAMFLSPSYRGGPEDVLFGMGLIAVTSLTAYCVAWLISSLQSSPTFAICAGLVTPLLVFMVIQAIMVWLLELRQPTPALMVTYIISCLITAVVSFSVGTWYFLRRVEP